MSKISVQRQTTRRVMEAAPKLKYIAFYHGTEERLNACMRDYADRSFVYILSALYEGEEYFLYVGKSKAQYARILSHSKKYAYDYIYLFECEPECLTESESAVIKELKPLFNRAHNPEAKRYALLQLDYNCVQSTQLIQAYLHRLACYREKGLYGFALSGPVFAALERAAASKGCNCSDMLQQILEEHLNKMIMEELDQEEAKETNLTTTKDYALKHERSQEQIKQYLHKKGRIAGALKVGRDWVIPQDTKFPESIYRKKQKEEK